jgi:ATP-dependent DNA ligase
MKERFYSPMLAKPMKDGFSIGTVTDWVAEEKLDGHRILVQKEGKEILAWSRHGKERDEVQKPRLKKPLLDLPDGVYDGELLVPGQRSYGTVVIENQQNLVFYVFDIPFLMGKDLTTLGLRMDYDERRDALEKIFEGRGLNLPVRLSWSAPLTSTEQIAREAEKVWLRDGEGLVLKNRHSAYHVGKRTRDWLKIKQCQTAVLTVVGFKGGTISKNSVTILEDADGNQTTVKWKNYEELDKIDANPESFIGRKLQIEYQERTPDGSYRHPMWDHWVDE